MDTLKVSDSLAVYQKEVDQFFKSIDLNTDYKITKDLFKLYDKEFGKCDWTEDVAIESFYKYSSLSSPTAFADLLFMEDFQDIRYSIKRDPIYHAYQYFDSIQKVNLKFLRGSLTKMNGYYSTYILALKEYNEATLIDNREQI